jgi:hypothetical protein
VRNQKCQRWCDGQPLLYREFITSLFNLNHVSNVATTDTNLAEFVTSLFPRFGYTNTTFVGYNTSAQETFIVTEQGFHIGAVGAARLPVPANCRKWLVLIQKFPEPEYDRVPTFANGRPNALLPRHGEAPSMGLNRLCLEAERKPEVEN